MEKSVFKGKILNERLRLQYERVNRKRKEEGKPKLTYEILAENCGVSREAIAAWLGQADVDKVNPRAKPLVDLSKELDCDVEYLLGLQDGPRREVFNVCASTGLSEEAAAQLLEWAKKKDGALSVLSTMITSDLFYCILSAATSTYEDGELHYSVPAFEDGVLWEKLRKPEKLYVSAKTLYDGERTAVFDKLLRFIDKIREDSGLVPLDKQNEKRK